MMRRVAALCMLGMLLPIFASAQTAQELQAQIQALLARIQALQSQIAAAQAAPTETAAACPALSRTLSAGARGDDVTALQVFLKGRGFFTDEATGYFGPITEAALQRWQAAQGVVSSGSPQTTGYGVLGPKTRAAIAAFCTAPVSSGAAASVDTATAATADTAASATASSSTVAQCPAIVSAAPPVTACAGTWQRLMSLGCQVGWRCVLSGSSNKPPVISSIDGPTSVALGSYTHWSVVAVDPEQGALSYSVTWGDEGVEDILRAIAGLGGTYVSSPTLSHAYAKAGAYTMNVSVRDSAGNVATISLPISVTASATGSDTSNAFGVFTDLTASTPSASCVTPWGAQVVKHDDTAPWQPFFTEGAYFSASSTPLMRCTNGVWFQCSATGTNCQMYTAATSTSSSAALPSYAGIIGTQCSHEGEQREVSVPPGTQLCQWLSCSVTTQVQTVKVRCTNAFWSDYKSY